jgi:FlaA1/EpsC-like NDP-sugar epimerase
LRRNEPDSMSLSATGMILALSRGHKRLIMLIADALAIPAAFWAALLLKFDRLDPDLDRTGMYFLVVIGASLLSFSVLGLYRAVVRFMRARAMLTIAMGVSSTTVVLVLYDRLQAASSLPLSTFVVCWALMLLYSVGSRFLVRYMLSSVRAGESTVRVAIYGAGDAGAKLCSVLLGGADFAPVAFLDDKKSLQGSSINGLMVYSPEVLPQLVRELRIERVLLAMPSASRRRRREILSALEPLGLHIQSLPHLTDLIDGRARVNELREVDVGDLLGRDPVPPNPRLFNRCIRGKSVLVTGAGGSIGSELCRQILQVRPTRLVLFEMSEIALYNIERELCEATARERLDVQIVPLLGSTRHRERLREILSAYAIQTVYHAAAYKHVPIVEHNVLEGVHNNVIGTLHAAEAAMESGVETFVLISTDKAVNPSNVMGATKRLAELVLQGLQERSAMTRFCMVRFGNVLASSGSVVPLFQEQIRRGGPVTVTHPEVIRYFMTIPEAAQLVIQAGSMATGGDVFVLDMGRPVRIDDLARRMISLMGFTVRDAEHPDGDIEIEYMGLRAAEKLFEELLIGSNVTGTDHPMILRAMEHRLPWVRMQQILGELRLALSSSDCHRTLAALMDAVAEYNCRGMLIRDYVWTRQQPAVPAAEARIADLAAKRRNS